MNAAEKELPARVIASHGRRVVVETPAGERVACAIQGRQLQVYCGDDVHWRRDGATDRGIVTDQLPRRSVLERTNATGRAEIIAANLTQLVVVIAAEPVPDWFIVDRFLAAAELSRLAALVVCNKADLPTPPQMQEELQNYRVVGYDVIECSNPHGTGI